MITVEIPRAWLLTSNQRLHWREIARRKAILREIACARTRQARLGTLHGRQHCTVWISWPNARKRDEHNLMPTVKHCVDGMVDANLLLDDDSRYLVGPDLRKSDERCDPRWAAVLTFTFEATQ